MASVNSPIRKFVKPFLFRMLGKRGYLYAQYFAKLKDIRDRLVEEKEMALLPKLVAPGDQVLDIGANYAYYTVRLSDLVGSRGKVFAFEPIPFTHDVCAKIVKHYGGENVELFQKGVGARAETISFNVPVLDFGGISAGQAHFGSRVNAIEEKKKFYDFDRHQQIKCEVVAADTFLSGKLDNLTFVKMDIEGAEYFALQGMREILSRFHPTILIEIQPYFLKGFGISTESFMSFLTDELGYKVFFYDSQRAGLRALETLPWDDNYILIHPTRLAHMESLFLEVA